MPGWSLVALARRAPVRAPSLILTVLGVVGALTACQQAVGVDDHLFACVTDDDCGPGWVCGHVPGNAGFKVCYQAGKAPDALPSDDVPDAADGGDDAEVLSCESNDDCRQALGLGPCLEAACVDGLCYAPKAVEGACDDGDPCTKLDTCVAGECVGETYSCESPLLCRTATCDGGGGCLYGTLEGFCLIDSQCYEDGTAHPSDACSRCEATESPNGWTPNADGTACDADGDACTAGDACASGVCQPGDAVVCDDGLGCTEDACVTVDGAPVCESVVAQGACLIDETCFEAGAASPDNACMACVPETDATQWSALADGAPCDADEDGCTVDDACAQGQCEAGAPADCDTGLGCTTDSCVSTGPDSYTCNHVPVGGSCFIGGQCFADGAVDPDNACRGCVASTSVFEWTPLAGGTACDADGDPCTVGDACSAGTCVKGGPADCDDGLDCTADACVDEGGQAECVHDTGGAACVIDQACVAAGAKNPSNPCLVCDPAQAVDGWSPAGDGTGCDADGDGCTVGDACLAGVCQAGAAADCDDGLACTQDACESQGADVFACSNAIAAGACLIDGVCFGEGQSAPEAACLACAPAVSATAWTPLSDGAPCNADDDGCTEGDACSAGACVPGPARVCDDGVACTQDLCVSTAADASSCDHPVEPGSCLVEGVCRAAGEVSPDGECYACDPDASATAWSPRAAGTVCEAGEGFCTEGLCFEVPTAAVPASSFWMGCNTTTDALCDANESPTHLVDTEAYRVDVYEVSVEAYGECVVAGGCTPPVADFGGCSWFQTGTEALPMNCVNWSQAAAFCGWIGRRLCSEAEWEKAARGGCDTLGGDCQTGMPLYPWGDDAPTCALTNLKGCANAPMDVDALAAGASPYGALNMAGNVAEWVQDCRHDGYSGAPTDGSAWTTGCNQSGPQPDRTYRGGSYNDFDLRLRTSSRRFFDPAGAGATLGFRCCADAP